MAFNLPAKVRQAGHLGFSLKLGAWDLPLCKKVSHNGFCVAVSANQYSPLQSGIQISLKSSGTLRGFVSGEIQPLCRASATAWALSLAFSLRRIALT